MNFNDHSKLEGNHAFLSASKHSWVRYDEEKLLASYANRILAAKGSRLHAMADMLITMRQKLPDTTATVNLYVNDCIGMRMSTEVVLRYSDNAFGTADAIRFTNNKLYIFDLKTGVSPASFEQLEIYVAFFCLEYGIPPHTIEVELRIYQNDDMSVWIPPLENIVFIMSQIKTFDRLIEEAKREAFA